MKGSLSTIVRSFKSAVTKAVHEHRLFIGRTVWQPRFHDHIIRDDIDHFFVEQYVELNPILWHLDFDNPDVQESPVEVLRETLQEKHGLKGFVLERIIEHELEYRAWWRNYDTTKV